MNYHINMPRKARIDAVGALHHIIVRGIERRAIFKDSLDYQNFIDRLSRVLTEELTPCYAWVLMPNHLHLLLRTGNVPISIVMRRLLTGYALQFNRRHGRHGHLFQNRFKSVLCEQDTYLLALVRYIHLNPLRAELVNNLNELSKFPYAGHAALVGTIQYPWQDTGFVLDLFDRSIAAARKNYVNFVAQGVALGRQPELVGGGLLRSVGGWSALKAARSEGKHVMGDERILGSNEFVAKVLKQADENYDRQTLAKARGLNLEKIIEFLADHFTIDGRMIRLAGKQRKVSRVRSIVCCLAVDLLEMSGAEIARNLNLTPSAVSKLVARGRGDKKLSQFKLDVFKFGDE
jgi:REP element-mobilizing transposase RayT